MTAHTPRDRTLRPGPWLMIAALATALAACTDPGASSSPEIEPEPMPEAPIDSPDQPEPPAGEDGVDPSDAWHPDPSCVPPANAAPVPETAREYAEMCAQHGLGVPPTVSCEAGVRVPIEVDGVEVFETPERCDNSSMLKPSCDVGSKIGRVEGRDADGNPLPDVVWVYFCRAGGAVLDAGSVQMIGHHTGTGATCFFEANESGDSYLYEVFGRDDRNGLTGQMPAPDEADFDRAFEPPFSQCVQCHQNNPYIRNPWLDGARMPDDPNEPVLPTLGANSPYYIVGGGDWDMRTIHIEGNACLDCHRVGMEIDQRFAANGFDVNTYMPPGAPGTLDQDYAELLECWRNGPENTPGCEWVIPPAGGCAGGVVDGRYPYPSPAFNRGGGDDGEGDEDVPACPEGFDPTADCVEDDFCGADGSIYYCKDGRWERI